ncbi:hypothetical protein SLS62_008628 [Diatrype stigma]|uniref:Uncharacterized protein n=1 Tax=Diatrype stigma TaxID=117547 RepID=A0AAN9UHZ0_9PEZI
MDIWSYAGYDVYTGTPWTPSDVLSRRHLEVDKTKLHIENLPLPSYSDLLEYIYTRGIPAENLASLRLTAPNPPLTTRLEPLQRLLLQARRLQTLDYRDSGQGTHFSFPPSSFALTATGDGDDNGERMLRLPALEELTLQSYDWDHDATDSAAHWDFSRLRALQLIDVPALPFLTAVPPRALRGLQALRCDDRSPSSYYASDTGRSQSRDAAVVTTQFLASLIHEIRALRSLELTCHTRLLFPSPPTVCDDDGGGGIHDNDDHDHDQDYEDEDEDEKKTRKRKSASNVPPSPEGEGGKRKRRRELDGGNSDNDHVLLRHAPTLRVLRLRDHVGLVDEDRRCPTLRAADVAGLARHLAHLRALELDLDAADCDDPARFLRALCAFPRLEALTLHVQTAVKPWAALALLGAGGGGEEEKGSHHHFDADYDAAICMFEALVRGKKERRQEIGEKTMVVPWRRITLVVGGWRPFMVRRTSAVWRALNARGVFAERCFVLEGAGEGTVDEGGDAAADIALLVREEMARTVEG